MPEVGDTLRTRLQHVTPTEARALVDAWKTMTCLNVSLIEFALLLTRLVNCNTAPLMLGASQSGKGAGLYMVKYMVKKASALQASLSVLLDARKHIDAYPTHRLPMRAPTNAPCDTSYSGCPTVRQRSSHPHRPQPSLWVCLLPTIPTTSDMRTFGTPCGLQMFCTLVGPF